MNKYCLLIIAFGVLFGLSPIENSRSSVGVKRETARFKNLVCVSNDENLFSIRYCKVVVFSRYRSGLSIGFTVNELVTDAFVSKLENKLFVRL